MAKVLLCDDNMSVLKLLEIRVTELGLNVIGKARDGEECIQLYHELNPDLLLLDLTMPNKDGREVLSNILILDSNAKVIMVSAISNQEVHDDCIRIGAKAFLKKSEINSVDHFNRKIMEILNGSGHVEKVSA